MNAQNSPIGILKAALSRIDDADERQRLAVYKAAFVAAEKLPTESKSRYKDQLSASVLELERGYGTPVPEDHDGPVALPVNTTTTAVEAVQTDASVSDLDSAMEHIMETCDASGAGADYEVSDEWLCEGAGSSSARRKRITPALMIFAAVLVTGTLIVWFFSG